jgi:tetratricopeptide (TPR) repeat protein
VAFSPDGKLVATGIQFDEVCGWDAATGEKKFAFLQGEAGYSTVMSLRFSPDGKRLATGTDLGTVRLWDVAAQQLLVSLKGHTQDVRSLAFSPDGKTLATASDDQTVKLWDCATGQERMTLKVGPVTCVAFAPDGKTLATGNAGGTAKLWRGATDQEARAFRDELDLDDPDSPVAFNAFADRLWKGGQPAAAADVYRKASARAEKLATAFPASAEYRLERAYSQFAAVVTRFTEGVPIPEQAHRQLRENCQKLPAEQQRLLARRYASLAWQVATGSDSADRNPGSAVELAKKAVELGPNELTDWGTVWDTLGMACYRAGDWKGAAEALNESLGGRGGADLRSWFVLSMAYGKLGATEEARKWYAAALVCTEKQFPNHAEVLGLRREAAALLGLSEKAADLAPQALKDHFEYLTLLLDANPRDASAYRNRALIHFSRGNYDRAAADLARLVELKPLDPQAWFDHGAVQLHLQKYAEAVADFSKCIELKADHIDAWHERGHAQEGLGRWKDSIADHTRAIELSPNDPQLHICCGNAYAHLEEWEKAAAAFERATTMRPAPPAAWYNLALLELRRGDHDGYRKVCSRMFEQFDRVATADVIYTTTWTYVVAPDALADWTKPLQFAEKGDIRYRTNYDLLNNSGAVLYRAGRFKEAAQRLAEAEAVFQQTPGTRSSIVYNWLFQAMAQHQLGNTTEAARWLKQAVQEIDEPKPAQDRASVTWNRRLTLQLLRREAEELLNK